MRQEHRKSIGCCARMSRRRFVGSMGAAAAATQMGIFEFASSLFGASGQSADRPMIRVAYIGPGHVQARKLERHQRRYRKILEKQAGELNVDLRIDEKCVQGTQEAASFVEAVHREDPDGLILISTYSVRRGRMISLANKFKEIPTVVFMPVGSYFTGQLHDTAELKGTFVAATQDEDWLASGLRMLDTIWEVKNTRLGIIGADYAKTKWQAVGHKREKTRDEEFGSTGMKLSYFPPERWTAEFEDTRTKEKIKALAEYYEKEADAIIEPGHEDILKAAKNYVVCRRIMEKEGLDGLSIHCLRMIGAGNYYVPCLAFARLRDELTVASCEGDVDAAAASRITHLLLERPGFMQDPAPDTVRNTLIGFHCACPTKLAGPDQPHSRFFLRTHHADLAGSVAAQVLWPEGKDVTIMKLHGPEKMILGKGRVVSNPNSDDASEGVDDPYEEAGACRTQVELELDGVGDARTVPGFHQLFILGDAEKELKAYAQLASIELEEF